MGQEKKTTSEKSKERKTPTGPSKDAVERENEPVLHTEGGEMPDPNKKPAADEALGDEAKKGAA